MVKIETAEQLCNLILQCCQEVAIKLNEKNLPVENNRIIILCSLMFFFNEKFQLYQYTTQFFDQKTKITKEKKFYDIVSWMFLYFNNDEHFKASNKNRNFYYLGVSLLQQFFTKNKTAINEFLAQSNFDDEEVLREFREKFNAMVLINSYEDNSIKEKHCLTCYCYQSTQYLPEQRQLPPLSYHERQQQSLLPHTQQNPLMTTAVQQYYPKQVLKTPQQINYSNISRLHPYSNTPNIQTAQYTFQAISAATTESNYKQPMQPTNLNTNLVYPYPIPAPSSTLTTQNYIQPLMSTPATTFAQSPNPPYASATALTQDPNAIPVYQTSENSLYRL